MKLHKFEIYISGCFGRSKVALDGRGCCQVKTPKGNHNFNNMFYLCKQLMNALMFTYANLENIYSKSPTYESLSYKHNFVVKQGNISGTGPNKSNYAIKNDKLY